MRYTSVKEAQDDHINNYRSDGIRNGKGTRYSADFHRVQWIVDSVPKEAYVLDVGCNSGVVSVRLNSKNCYCRAIDIVDELVLQAQKNGVAAKKGTAENLSQFVNGKFDVVVCTEVLEHLYDPLVAIKEAHRVLKQGGKYVITVPHPHSIMNDKLGDYHQTNFTIEILHTLLYSVFEKNTCSFVEIPYVEEYCAVNNINKNRPQWLGIICRKI